MRSIHTRTGAAAARVLLFQPAIANEWSYSGGTGPEHWGGVTPACERGRMQSPIDLDDADVVADIPVFVDYTPGEVQVRNLGSTIQADFSGGSYLVSSGKVFELVQVHFHTPSEHTILGESFPLVAHFVHASGAGELAVLGILFEAGDENEALQLLIDAAPGSADDDQGNAMLDARELVPDELEVYRYMGSLTTPPCSEGVNWHVAEATLEASEEQIEALTNSWATTPGR